MSHFNRSSQSGATLILGVMVLASISVISFSLAAIVLREIKASRQLIKSEPAVTAAEAGGEVALFYRIRLLTTHDPGKVACPDEVTEDFGVANFSVCNNFYDLPFTFTTSAADSKVVVLYDPTNFDSQAAGYSSLEVHVTSGSASQVRVEIYDLSQGFGSEGCGTNPRCLTVSMDGIGQLTGLDPNKSYAVFLIPLGGSTVTAVGTLTGNDGQSGIPSDNPTIYSTGSKDEVLRRLEILLK